MPQVAARITHDHEQWLKNYFRTKSAGAEFILPWAVDMFFKFCRLNEILQINVLKNRNW